MSVQQQGAAPWTESVDSGAATVIRRAVLIDTGTEWQFSDTTAIAAANLTPDGTGDYAITAGATDPNQMVIVSTPTEFILI